MVSAGEEKGIQEGIFRSKFIFFAVNVTSFVMELLIIRRNFLESFFHTHSEKWSLFSWVFALIRDKKTTSYEKPPNLSLKLVETK